MQSSDKTWTPCVKSNFLKFVCKMSCRIGDPPIASRDNTN